MHNVVENGAFFLNVFVFSFMHERAHALAAAAVGGHGRTESRGMFGNVMYLEPGLGASRRMAVYLAGPAFNIVLAAAGAVLLMLVRGCGRQAAGQAGTGIFGNFQPAALVPFGKIFELLEGTAPLALGEIKMAVYANIMLAAFNLMPFYPLDGGRAAVLLLSQIIGQRASAAAACVFSVLFAVSVFILGLYLVQYNIMNTILIIDAFYFLYIFEREINEIL